MLDRAGTGRKDYTIFQVGKATLLRVSDVLSLKKSDVFDNHGRVRRKAYTIDKKTNKHNILYLKAVQEDLEEYFDWLESFQINACKIPRYQHSSFNGNIIVALGFFQVHIMQKSTLIVDNIGRL
nr:MULTISPECIES: hypothetical protein [unclassified Lactobacillus]